MPDFGIFRGFGSKLFSDKLYAGQLPTELGLIGSEEVFDVDPDAQAFFDRVTAAGGTLSATEKTAIDALVKQMKSDVIWTKMEVIYPMVGASAAACSQNLKSSSFTGNFTSGWTFAGTGATPNGTSAYMNSNFNPNGQITSTNAHLSFYQANVYGVNDQLHGIISTQRFFIDLYGVNELYAALGTSESNSTTSLNKNAMHILNSLNSTAKIFRNTTELTTWTSSGAMPNLDVFFGAANNGGSGIYFTTGKLSFCSIGYGLTDIEASNFYTAVQAFNTTLSRQV